MTFKLIHLHNLMKDLVILLKKFKKNKIMTRFFNISKPIIRTSTAMRRQCGGNRDRLHDTNSYCPSFEIDSQIFLLCLFSNSFS